MKKALCILALALIACAPLPKAIPTWIDTPGSATHLTHHTQPRDSCYYDTLTSHGMEFRTPIRYDHLEHIEDTVTIYHTPMGNDTIHHPDRSGAAIGGTHVVEPESYMIRVQAES